jgi:UDP-GlcNAc:undecaprenyl-phosphate/decaprenyl-phosphate GlcNAc-1-phosphate transferase
MKENLLVLYSIFFLASLMFSIIINRFLLKFSKTLGIRDTTHTIIRWSSTSKPALGGISFYIIFLVSLIFISFVLPEGEIFFNLKTLGLLIAVTMGFLMGLFDDAYNTQPWIKFFTQISCGIILIITGTYISLFDSLALNYLLTIFWVVGMMNSINMLDNMDGITTIVSLSVCTAIFTMLIIGNDFANPIMGIVIGSMAALTGFLFYNWNPSRMYMGDTGSQFLGVLLAALGISFFWNGEGFRVESYPWMRFISVAIIFALPIIDTTTVSIKRLAQGNSPFVGGRDHTTHHLSYLGLSDRQVAMVFIALSVVSFLLTLSITQCIHSWTTMHSVWFGAYFIVLFAVLFTIANLNRKNN